MNIRRNGYRCAGLLLLASASLLAQSAGTLSADLDPGSRARLPYLQRKDMDEKAQKPALLIGPAAWNGRTAARRTAASHAWSAAAGHWAERAARRRL